MFADLEFLTAMGRLTLYLLMLTGSSLFIGCMLIVGTHLVAWHRERANG